MKVTDIIIKTDDLFYTEGNCLNKWHVTLTGVNQSDGSKNV